MTYILHAGDLRNNPSVADRYQTAAPGSSSGVYIFIFNGCMSLCVTSRTAVKCNIYRNVPLWIGSHLETEAANISKPNEPHQTGIF